MKRAGFLLTVFFVPTFAFASEEAISRRDGFLVLWQSIQRKTEETRESPFTDVPEGTLGYAEITYVKRRGILDDTQDRFRPDDSLMLEDALLWLFRTRSIDEIEKMRREDLPELLARYPLGKFIDAGTAAESPTIKDRTIPEKELLLLMQDLDRLLREEQHEVSLYAEKFHGDGTAFGETFDMNALTAAHRTFPHNTLVRVTNVENGKSVVVRINDRGPFVEGRDMDLSLGAFVSIADRAKGKIIARFERLGDSALVSTCGDAPVLYQQRITKDLRFIRGVPHSLSLGHSLTLTATRPFVVRSVLYPDGRSERLQDFVLKDERFTFTPSVPGEYQFRFGSIYGRSRMMRMKVEACDEDLD